MKTLPRLLLLLALTWSGSATAIEAYFDYVTFHIPGQGPMVETHLNFFGETVQYSPTETGLQATVEITMIFFDGDSIVNFSKKSLKSGVIQDSLFTDFIDQQRFMLDYGEYVLEVQLSQANAPEESVSFSEAIIVNPPEQAVFSSDIQWISAYKKATETSDYTKSGYDLLPFVSNYVPHEMNDLLFYAEIYGTAEQLGAAEPFLITYYIENFDSKKRAGDFMGRMRAKASPVVPMLKQIDVSHLSTGNYNLIIEARDRENNLIAESKRFFQRVGAPREYTDTDYAAVMEEHVFSKQITNIDTLYAYIESLVPIAGPQEVSLIYRFEKNKDLDMMQRFLYNFWYSRDNLNPALAWQEYLDDVRTVESKYGTPNKHGYETDMGRIHLTYGAPDVVTDRPNEPSSYPYQIWQYFRAGTWANVRMVFYDRTLLQSDYELLHCDKIPGEIKNPRWDMLIHQRDTPLHNIDQKQSKDHFGGRTQDLWETPR